MLQQQKRRFSPARSLIDGQWVDGAKNFDTINPATGEVLTQIAEASADGRRSRGHRRPQGVRRSRRALAQDVRQ